MELCCEQSGRASPWTYLPASFLHLRISVVETSYGFGVGPALVPIVRLR
jgi:hypothetical protein